MLRNGSRLEGKDCRLGKLAVQCPSNRKHLLPKLWWQPQDVLHRIQSLGGHHPTRWPPQPGPEDAGVRITSGSAQTWLHQPLPGSISPPPSFPSGCISAHFGTVIPAGCAAKGERSQPWSLFELQLGKSSEISARTAGDAHLHTEARKPRSSCFKRVTAVRQGLERHPLTPQQTSAGLSSLYPHALRNPHSPLQTFNFQSSPRKTQSTPPPSPV